MCFLGIKGIEWHEKWEKHHIPGIHNYSEAAFLNPASDPEVYKEYHDKPLSPAMAAEDGGVFLSLLRHDRHARPAYGDRHRHSGLHFFRARTGAYTNGHYTFIENFGLYWHFVDIIWIFLFPLLYLISRY